MERINKILECSLYANDLEAIEKFYGRIFNFEVISKKQNRHIFYRIGDMVLLYFNPVETSIHLTEEEGNIIPLHGAMGFGHIAFSVTEESLSKWKEILHDNEVEIESEVTWRRGGKSLYFRDPAGNSIELATPELWK